MSEPRPRFTPRTSRAPRSTPSRVGAAALALLVAPALLAPAPAHARPPGPQVFCATYPESPACAAQTLSCAQCHGAPPTLDVYGAALAANLAQAGGATTSDADFVARLPDALEQIEPLDADGDGASNLVEILQGFDPGDAASVPAEGGCEPGEQGACAWDPILAFERVTLDVCGYSPSRSEREALGQAPDPRALVHAQLDACLDSDFWQGPGGALERLSYPKVRPRKPFERATVYREDFKLFVYTQIDDHDARDLLRADYLVDYSDGSYSQVPGNQPVVPERRAGMLTTVWFLSSNTMGQAIPRVTAAQAYRAYLGYDLSDPDGVFPAPNEPQDYDAKGVDAAECAVCHSTLDPLAYMFSRYRGSAEPSGRRARGYDPNRLLDYVPIDGPRVADAPEQGYLFGEPVEDLVTWGERASETDAFARTIVTDYWRLLIGHAPRPDELADFERVWRDFASVHQWRVEPMLHDLIDTEAYGVP